jgi:hypothetical protein
VFGIDFSSLPESFDASGQVSSKPGEVQSAVSSAPWSSARSP